MVLCLGCHILSFYCCAVPVNQPFIRERYGFIVGFVFINYVKPFAVGLDELVRRVPYYG